MTYFETEQPDFVDEMIAALEEDYQCEVERVARMKQISKYVFAVSVIFTDYRLLDAEIQITERYGLPCIEIRGVYY